METVGTGKALETRTGADIDALYEVARLQRELRRAHWALLYWRNRSGTPNAEPIPENLLPDDLRNTGAEVRQ